MHAVEVPGMDADLLTEGDDKIELRGSPIIAAIKASGIEYILSVPDIVTSGGLLRPITRDRGLKPVRVMMKQAECLRILKRHVTDEVVVATFSSAVDWLALGERTLNYFAVGAMGLDSSHALGLALGRPDQRIICLQGDGSFLMNLGCLVTIAAAAPRNLVHIVVQNGTYEANGGHPIPHTQAEFASIARAAR